MRFLQLFIDLKPEEYAPLMSKYQDEAALKFFMCRVIKKAIAQELEHIETEQALQILTEVTKL